MRRRGPARRRRFIFWTSVIALRLLADTLALSLTRKRETGRVGYAGLVPRVRRSIARTTLRIARALLRLLFGGPSRRGVSLSWIGPRRRADFRLKSGVTLNRAPRARLARLAGEPPVARDVRSLRVFWRCRISLHLSTKVRARASGPHWRLCLKGLRKCGPEARAPTCEGRCVCGG